MSEREHPETEPIPSASSMREAAEREGRFDLSGDENKENRDKATDILGRAEKKILEALKGDTFLHKLQKEDKLTIAFQANLSNPEKPFLLSVGFFLPDEEFPNEERKYPWDATFRCALYVARLKEPTQDKTIELWVEWGKILQGEEEMVISEELQKAMYDIFRDAVQESEENRKKKE